MVRADRPSKDARGSWQVFAGLGGFAGCTCRVRGWRGLVIWGRNVLGVRDATYVSKLEGCSSCDRRQGSTQIREDSSD